MTTIPNKHYLRAEFFQGHCLTGSDPEYIVYFKTPNSEGHERFKGHKARDEATAFTVQKLQEMSLDNP